MARTQEPSPRGAHDATASPGENTKESTKKRGNPQNLRPPWKPGQSGNPGGRPKKIITGMIEAELARVVPGDKERRTWLQLMVQAQIRQAIKGDVKSFAEITDRVEGKAMQALQMSGPNGSAIQVDAISREEREKRIAELLAKAGMK